MKHDYRKVLFSVFAMIAIAMLFYSSYSIHHKAQMPLHVDSWISISIADDYNKQEKITDTEPFSGTKLFYPKGSYVFISALSQLTGLDLITIGQILPAFILIGIGMLQYLVFRQFYEKPIYGLLPVFFSLLILSNMTILGPFYLVPVAFGMLLYMLLLYFVIKEDYIMQIISFLGILAFHRSTAILGSITIAIGLISQLIDRKSRIKKIFPFAFMIGLLIFSGFYTFVYSDEDYEFSEQIGSKFDFFIDTYLVQHLERPFLNYVDSMGFIVFILIALGMFAFIDRQKWKVIVFTFFLLVLALFIYWNKQAGILIPYRRVVSYIYLFTPLFFSAGIIFFIEKISDFAQIAKGKKNIFLLPSLFIISLLLLVPYTYNINQNEIKSIVWVTPSEDTLFRKFSEAYHNETLVAGHLESYSLPYYGIRPVILSPRHPGNHNAYEKYFFAYSMGDVDAMKPLFSEKDIKFIYYEKGIESDKLEKVMSEEDGVIYRYSN